MEIVKQAWAVEDRLIRAGRSPAPSTDIRQVEEKARTIESRLMVCALSEEGEEKKDLLDAEWRNLQFITGAQHANAGLAQDTPLTEFPLDLEEVAPLCKGIVKTKLLASVESALTGDDQKLSLLKSKDVMPYFDESTKLLKCAYEAQRSGYKDAAFRILYAAFAVENAMVLADTHDQAEIVKVLRSASTDSSVPIEVGPRHCRATIQDWGWQKTVAWDCY